MKRVLLAIFVLWSGAAFGAATDIYLTPTGSGTCMGHLSEIGGPVFFNTSLNWGTGPTQIGPGTTVHLCGNFTGAAGATILTAQGNGSLANPITIKFEAGATVSAPYLSGTNGGIDIHGRSNITIDGQNTGIVQNTANGDGLANQHITTGIFASGCTNCIIKNLTVANIYIAIQNFATPVGGAATQMNAIYITGQNNTLTGNTIHDCGWCIYDPYGAGDTNMQVTGNEIYNWDHAMMFATASAISCTAPCLFLSGNKIHDDLNWETAGCVYHLDGLHTFGVLGSTMNGVYIFNNYFYGGQSGACSSGFLFIEQGSPSMTNGSNFNIWNNVFDASAANGVNPNGWVGVFGVIGGTNRIVNNTLLCPSSTDNSTVGWGIGSPSSAGSIIFENNVENKCPQGNNVRRGSGTFTADNNYYGNPCSTTNNCWVWSTTGSPAFQSTFAAWKTACSCDAHSSTTASDAALHLNSNGSLQATSPAIEWGINLGSISTGNLASLASDTTQGGNLTPTARPATATCTTQGSDTNCWDAGAYNFTGTAPAVLISPNPLDFGNVIVGTTTPPQTVTVQNTGSANLIFSSVSLFGSGFNFSLPTTCVTGGVGLAPGSSCTVRITANPSITGLITGGLTLNSNAASSPDVGSLSVTGIPNTPTVSLSPSTLSFGNQTVLVPSTPQTIHLTNTGGAVLNISNIALAGVFNSNNVDNSSSGWRKCWAGGIGPENCAPGGSGTVTSGPTQTFGNATPSLDGSSEKIAFAGTAFTDVLFIYEAGAHNTATRFQGDYEVYITPGNYQDLEFDTYQYLTASLDEYMFGSQCQVGAKWQIWNALTGAWVNTNITCTLSTSTFHHITWNVHRIAGDTSCASGHPCMYYDSLTIDGVVNVPACPTSPCIQPAGVLPGTFANQTGLNFQMDTNGSGGAVAENLDYVGMAGATDYSLTTTCGATLGVGLGCDVIVTFTPSGTGLKSDSVVFTTNASSSPDSVPINGTGVNASAVVCPKFSGGVSIQGGVQFKCN